MRLLSQGQVPCIVASMLCLSACATLQDSTRPVESKAAAPAPAPRYNLIGYSAAFKHGYADACASPRRQNAARFKSDTEYSMGWQDGSSACRSR